MMNLAQSIKTLFHELRRRRVVRVIVVYAVVAWAMVEVAINAAPLLELPAWTPTFVLLMSLIGFPLAVILAWAYEITPEGVRRTDSEDAAPTKGPLGPGGLGVGKAPAVRRGQARRDFPRTNPPENRPAAPPDAGQLRRAVLAGLRHEFRTPLIAVLGYSEMLLEDATPEQTPGLREIQATGRRVLVLIDELLRPAASGEALSEEALASMRDRIREQLEAPVNAIVEASRAALCDPQVTRNAEMVPDLERIAEAAGRLKVLVEAEGYVVEPAEGARPTPEDVTRDVAARVIAALPSRGVGAADYAPPRHGQILVVDDNEDNRDLLSRQLARQGFSVSVAGDGTAALEMLRAQDFDLVLLDVLMPGLDGIEVLTQLQRDPTTADVPVIMTSALDEIDGVVRCIEQGAVDYLTKPFDPVLLQARVGATLDLHRLRAQQRRARHELDDEIAWSARLIRSLVPDPLMERVREGRGTLVEEYDDVTALAVTIHGLGTFATRHGAAALGEWMGETVAAFDDIVRELPLEVHWEAGATLIASTGTIASRGDQTAAIAELALRLRETAAARSATAEPVRIGIGIHTGPAVAGLIDGERVAFGLWGEAPDVARELAWQCPDGEAQVSPAAYAALYGSYAFEERGMIETSGQSKMRKYGLVGRRELKAVPEG